MNKERLSRSGEESNPVEIKAGDELQFGVDVIENKKGSSYGMFQHMYLY